MLTPAHRATFRFFVRLARGAAIFRTFAAATLILTARACPSKPSAAASASTAGATAASDLAKHAGAVKSPMVGTAYLAPEPGARPFVEVGSMIAAGASVLIIEAMKTMNQIPAPRSGRVSQILIGDGQPVEFGEPLVIIE